jgi:hypothetical protein
MRKILSFAVVMCLALISAPAFAVTDEEYKTNTLRLIQDISVAIAYNTEYRDKACVEAAKNGLSSEACTDAFGILLKKRELQVAEANLMLKALKYSVKDRQAIYYSVVPIDKYESLKDETNLLWEQLKVLYPLPKK